MNSTLDPREKKFFATPRMPCPYLPGKFERKVFTELWGDDAGRLHDALAAAGFRRSQGVVYRPLCDDCAACVPVRAVAKEFRPRKWMRRVVARTAHIEAGERPATATAEQFRLFRRYLSWRHADGGMMDMDFDDYRSMVEDTPVSTSMVEFREPGGRLVGACLTDAMADGLSMVYSFSRPDLRRLSLGSAIVLWHIRRAAELGLDYVYLGYWIAESEKMAYKTRFAPIEALGPRGWVPLRRRREGTAEGDAR